MEAAAPAQLSGLAKLLLRHPDVDPGPALRTPSVISHYSRRREFQAHIHVRNHTPPSSPGSVAVWASSLITKATKSRLTSPALAASLDRAVLRGRPPLPQVLWPRKGLRRAAIKRRRGDRRRPAGVVKGFSSKTALDSSGRVHVDQARSGVSLRCAGHRSRCLGTTSSPHRDIRADQRMEADISRRRLGGFPGLRASRRLPPRPNGTSRYRTPGSTTMRQSTRKSVRRTSIPQNRRRLGVTTGWRYPTASATGLFSDPGISCSCACRETVRHHSSTLTLWKPGYPRPSKNDKRMVR